MNKIYTLESSLKQLYALHNKELLFHGWHHINFVRNKAKEFASRIGANTDIVEAAALVHDLNYVVKKFSEPEVGEKIRKEYLINSGYDQDEIDKIEKIILEAHMANRSSSISLEAQALSDADTLFKSLPITPIIFAGKYLIQNNVDIKILSKKVCDEQLPLMEQGIYFYTDIAKEKYSNWAKVNLNLWQNVQESLNDIDVQELLKDINSI
jgi:uncharacterized protein